MCAEWWEDMRDALEKEEWHNVWHFLRLAPQLSIDNLQHIIYRVVCSEAWIFLAWVFNHDSIDHQLFFDCLYPLPSPDDEQKFLCHLLRGRETEKVMGNVFISGLRAREFDFLKRVIVEAGKYLSSHYDEKFCLLHRLVLAVSVHHPGNDLLHELFQELREDGQEACCYFSVFLAVKLQKKRFDYICEVLRTRRVQLGVGGSTLFDSALVHGEFECAARILQTMLSPPKYMLHCSVVHMIRRLEDFVTVCERQQQFWTKSCTTSFIAVCEEHKLCAAGALMCILSDNFFLAGKLLLEEKSHVAFETVMGKVFNHVQWKLCLRVLFNRPALQLVADSAVLEVPYVVRKASYDLTLPTKVLVRELVRHCRDPTAIGAILSGAIEVCDSRLFRQVLAMDLVDLRSLSSNCGFINQLLIKMNNLWHGTDPPNTLRKTLRQWRTGRNLWKIFRLCIEVGMNSVEKDKWGSQLLTGHICTFYAIFLDLIMILYKTGMASGSEIHYLSADPCQRRCYRLEKKKKVQVLLDSLARHPRTLRDLTRHAVSDLIGCHADRKQRVLSLELPIELHRLLLFEDALYRQYTV